MKKVLSNKKVGRPNVNVFPPQKRIWKRNL